MKNLKNSERETPKETEFTNSEQLEEFDLDAIRLSQNYPEISGVKKLLTTVTVRKPNKMLFFRTHIEHRIDVMILKYGERDDHYVVIPELQDAVDSLAKPHRLVLAVDSNALPFIWPLAIPDEDSPLPWHTTAMDADALAKDCWVRIQANRSLGAYEIIHSKKKLSEPIWPEATWPKLMEIAFKQKIIDSHEHIVLQKLRGEL